MINVETAKELRNNALLEAKRQYEMKLNNYVEELGETIERQAKLGFDRCSIRRTSFFLKDDADAESVAKKISEHGFETRINTSYLEISWK